MLALLFDAITHKYMYKFGIELQIYIKVKLAIQTRIFDF